MIMAETLPVPQSVTGKRLSLEDPIQSYIEYHPVWKRNRAVCGGDRQVKKHDLIVSYENILIPFSPSMTPYQYRLYQAEAELPEISSQYAKILIGGLLRKKPQLELPEDAPEGAEDWIVNDFSQDGSSLISFLDNALWTEVQTSRCWVLVDYPEIDVYNDTLDTQDYQELKIVHPVCYRV